MVHAHMAQAHSWPMHSWPRHTHGPCTHGADTLRFWPMLATPAPRAHGAKLGLKLTRALALTLNPYISGLDGAGQERGLDPQTAHLGKRGSLPCPYPPVVSRRQLLSDEAGPVPQGVLQVAGRLHSHLRERLGLSMHSSIHSLSMHSSIHGWKQQRWAAGWDAMRGTKKENASCRGQSRLIGDRGASHKSWGAMYACACMHWTVAVNAAAQNRQLGSCQPGELEHVAHAHS